MNPTVSVITVSYNTAASLESTIQSVLNQQDVMVEYILIDGGSTDGTAEILERYRDRLAYCVSEPDGGVYDAMNKGMAVATGDWLFFIGADDQLASTDILSQMWQYLADRPIDWQNLDLVFGDVRFLAGEKIVRRYNSRFDTSLYLKNRLHHQGAFYRRELLQVPMVMADCQVGGLSGRVIWSGWQEEMTVRHRHLGRLASLPSDALGAVRYGIKQVQKLSGKQ
jgi:putative colanic acid biosynthesis glycosyltransferase